MGGDDRRGTKRVCVESDDSDGSEIMALLDEIDRVNPSSVAGLAAGGDASSSGDAGNNGDAGNGLDASRDRGAGIRGASDGGARGNGEASSDREATARGDTGDLVQCLPHPFFPDAFTVERLRANARAIRAQTAGLYEWEGQFTSLATVLAGREVHAKAALLLVMVQDCPVKSSDVGVVFVDEFGDRIGGTIDGALFGASTVRIHFGLVMVLTNVTILQLLPARPAKGLIVTAENVARIYANVHHV